MATTKIHYVGLKEVENAYKDRTGISWAPGDSHDLETGLASVLLQHPDVFSDTAPKVAPKAVAPVDINSATVTTLTDHHLDVMEGFMLANVGLDAWNGLREGERADWIAKAIADDGSAAKTGTAGTLEKLTAEQLEALDLDALKDLAAERKVKHHVAAGAPKIRAAILAAQG